MSSPIRSYQQLANEFEERERQAWRKQIAILRARLKTIMSYYDIDLDDADNVETADLSKLDLDDIVEATLIIEEIQELKQYV